MWIKSMWKRAGRSQGGPLAFPSFLGNHAFLLSGDCPAQRSYRLVQITHGSRTKGQLAC